MTAYYKATRPDGKDFRTGTINYVAALTSSETIDHPRTARYTDMRPNWPGTYLSVSVEPGETLIGGTWPCRVFRVEPVGRVVKRTDGRCPHKRGCRALRVVEELPAHVALGPNGEAVAATIERARRLTYEDATDLRAARGAARGAARDAARDAAIALTVRDLITPEQFDVLYEPWAKVIG